MRPRAAPEDLKARAQETTRSGPSRLPELSQHGARAFYVGGIGSDVARWSVCLSVMFVARSVSHAAHFFFLTVRDVFAQFSVGVCASQCVCRLPCLTAHICWANLSTHGRLLLARDKKSSNHTRHRGEVQVPGYRGTIGAGVPEEANANLALVGIKGTAAPWSATPRKHRPQRPSCPRGQARSPHCA